ncbi:MAG: GNAT family N-acetyltransferase [Anaerolineae bacterium]
MSIEYRLEVKENYFETENMTREAFWDLFKPGCNEHFLLHQLRKSRAFIPELDYVACDDGILVGNVIYTQATISDGMNKTTVLCMGPLCVAPSYQNRGIGSALLQKTIELAGKMGYKAVVTFGDPGYYHRFGFRNAKEFGIQTSQGENFDAFMVLELVQDGLQGVSGKFYEDEAFTMDANEFEKYDKQFLHKEKHVREGQFET